MAWFFKYASLGVVAAGYSCRRAKGKTRVDLYFFHAGISPGASPLKFLKGRTTEIVSSTRVFDLSLNPLNPCLKLSPKKNALQQKSSRPCSQHGCRVCAVKHSLNLLHVVFVQEAGYMVAVEVAGHCLLNQV